jgi:uncharacterized membrane protein YkgB
MKEQTNKEKDYSLAIGFILTVPGIVCLFLISNALIKILGAFMLILASFATWGYIIKHPQNTRLSPKKKVQLEAVKRAVDDFRKQKVQRK